MIPKSVRVKMTKAQMSVYISNRMKLNAYERREKRLHAKKYYGVRVEVDDDSKKCYVMSHLVVCLPKSRSYRLAFDDAVQTVLDTLVAVNSINV